MATTNNLNEIDLDEVELTPEEAIRILKRDGIWERISDGKHQLRLIVGGVVETQWLKLDRRSRQLKHTNSEYDCNGGGGAFFSLRSKDGTYRELYDEFTEAFDALVALLE